TGATGNLGSVVARSLAEKGARLALFSTNAERLERLGSELGLPGERWMSGAYDFGEPGAAQAAADSVVARFGRAEVLWHLVGGWAGGKPLAEVAADDVANMLRQHVWTTYY